MAKRTEEWGAVLNVLFRGAERDAPPLPHWETFVFDGKPSELLSSDGAKVTYRGRRDGGPVVLEIVTADVLVIELVENKEKEADG